MVRRQPTQEADALNLPPARTLEGREDRMIAKAMNLAEKRMDAEIASSQEIIHFLRLGSTRNLLEKEKIRQENLVLETRVKEMESRKTSEEMYAKALNAMRVYQGVDEMQTSGEEFVDEDL